MNNVLQENKAPGFTSPTALPTTSEQHRDWQAANQAWWERHPMRYDWRAPLTSKMGTREWYQELDARSFASHVVPSKSLPFDGLIPYADLPQMRVLEIGVGMGTHAQLLAQHAAKFTGIDLTAAAVEATQRRFELFGVRGELLQMNAEKLEFPDASFDLIWSWGVIHHSANTRAVLAEMRRVLRPSGEARVMVYHRALVPWYFYDGFIRGVLLRGLWKHGNIHGVVQSVTDGALARYYTRAEWRREIAGLFQAESLAAYGARGECLPLPAGPVKQALISNLPQALFAFWLNTLDQGRLLYSRLKPSGK